MSISLNNSTVLVLVNGKKFELTRTRTRNSNSTWLETRCAFNCMNRNTTAFRQTTLIKFLPISFFKRKSYWYAMGDRIVIILNYLDVIHSFHTVFEQLCSVVCILDILMMYYISEFVHSTGYNLAERIVCVVFLAYIHVFW